MERKRLRKLYAEEENMNDETAGNNIDNKDTETTDTENKDTETTDTENKDNEITGEDPEKFNKGGESNE